MRDRWLAGFSGVLILGSAVALLIPLRAESHGVVGKRFLPSTLAIEDPFVSDELSLPVVGVIRQPGEVAGTKTRVLTISGEYSKTITPRLGISIDGEFLRLDPTSSDSESGFGNLGLGAKFQFLTLERHELVATLGLDAEVGSTGDAGVGAESFSIISPALAFGKGMGDLPDPLQYLRPLAITGILGASFPTDHTVARTLNWGFSIQYNLHYLESYVRDIGLGQPFDRLIPLVEFGLESCLERSCSGQTTGTANPGIIWFGKFMQLGIEAQIPVNNRTGESAGVVALVHFFIDDLFPKTLGKPLFGDMR